MTEENDRQYAVVDDRGRELVTVGTPEFPAEIWGAWEKDSFECRSLVPWHWHDELEINVVVEGRMLGRADGKNFCLQKGQALFINSGVMHGNKAVNDGEKIHQISILFHTSLVGGAPGSVFWRKYLAPLVAAPECRCVPLRGETEWERQALLEVQRVVTVWQQKAPGWEFEVRAALSRVISLLVENCVQHAPAPTEQELRDAERIKQMVDFVRRHRKDRITTEQIAASAAISVSECLRCFRRTMNLTPKEYQRQHAIRHAVRLLVQTDMNISRIGEECGFEDMSYFARVFRAEKGCTPSEYRAMNKKSV